MNPVAVRCKNISKSFGSIQAVRNLDLEVYKGEILALVGPSGCGKTTLLRLLAGFETPDSGTITIQDRPVAGDSLFVPPEQRGVGMVFQDYALFPHLTVGENVAFGLSISSKSSRTACAEALLEMVGLSGYGRRHPHELSGGERQRVALARALAPQPVVVLLDEPFSNLDADRRARMREEVRSIFRETQSTAVFVTHDQEEALFLGDRLAVLCQGNLEQIDSPDTVFGRPATRFVADFMGPTDFLPGKIMTQGILTEIGLLAQPCELPQGTQVEVAVRADDIQIVPQAGAPGVVLGRRYHGVLNIYTVKLPSGVIVHSIQPHTLVLPPDTRVAVCVDPQHELAFFPFTNTAA